MLKSLAWPAFLTLAHSMWPLRLECCPFSGADRGTFDGFDNTAGTVTGIARSNVGPNAGGTLVKLRFQAIGAGTSALSIPPASVTLSCEIPFTKKDGTVFVFDPPRT